MTENISHEIMMEIISHIVGKDMRSYKFDITPYTFYSLADEKKLNYQLKPINPDDDDEKLSLLKNIIDSMEDQKVLIITDCLIKRKVYYLVNVKKLERFIENIYPEDNDEIFFGGLDILLCFPLLRKVIIYDHESYFCQIDWGHVSKNHLAL